VWRLHCFSYLRSEVSLHNRGIGMDLTWLSCPDKDFPPEDNSAVRKCRSAKSYTQDR